MITAFYKTHPNAKRDDEESVEEDDADEKPIEEHNDDDPSEESNSSDNSTGSDVVHPPMIAVKFNCVSKILEIMIEWNCDSRNFIIGVIRINVSVFNEPVEEFIWCLNQIHRIKKTLANDESKLKGFETALEYISKAIRNGGLFNLSSGSCDNKTPKKQNKNRKRKVVENLNLLWFIDETQCFALNAMDEWNYAVFELEDSIFRSELNQPEFFLHLTFRKLVKIDSIGIHSSKENGPKIVKLFINQQQTVDLDYVKTNEPVKILEFDAEQLDCGTPILMNDNEFDNVHSISFLFVNNQNNLNQTMIKCLSIIGKPISSK